MDKNIQVIVGKDDKKVDVNDVKFLQELTSFDNKHQNSVRRRASSMGDIATTKRVSASRVFQALGVTEMKLNQINAFGEGRRMTFRYGNFQRNLIVISFLCLYLVLLIWTIGI